MLNSSSSIRSLSSPLRKSFRCLSSSSSETSSNFTCSSASRCTLIIQCSHCKVSSCCAMLVEEAAVLVSPCHKSYLVKISEQPGLGWGEGAGASKGVPDWQCAANELVASGRVHGVDAHVGATQPNRPLRGEGASRIILWHHQAMPATGTQPLQHAVFSTSSCSLSAIRRAARESHKADRLTMCQMIWRVVFH